MRNIKWIALACLAFCVPVLAASFDCAKARTPVEKLICADPTLSKLDEMLAEAYEQAIQARDASTDLQQHQRRWLTQRSVCRTVKCLESTYIKRILQLRAEETCLLDLNIQNCLESGAAQEMFPRTVDGRLVLLTRRQCRFGFDGPDARTSKADGVQIQADCIEAGIYEPCDEATSLNQWASCGWSHVTVAERRIRRAELRIMEFSRKSAGVTITPNMFAVAHTEWLAFREKHCNERDQAFVLAFEAHIRAQIGEETAEDRDRDMGTPKSRCLRDITEQRAEGLEAFLGVAGMTPEKLDREGLLDYLRQSGPK